MNHSRAEDTAPLAMQTAAIKQAEGEGERGETEKRGGRRGQRECGRKRERRMD